MASVCLFGTDGIAFPSEDSPLLFADLGSGPDADDCEPPLFVKTSVGANHGAALSSFWPFFSLTYGDEGVVYSWGDFAFVLGRASSGEIFPGSSQMLLGKVEGISCAVRDVQCGANFTLAIDGKYPDAWTYSEQKMV
jgi:hypothetical protein